MDEMQEYCRKCYEPLKVKIWTTPNGTVCKQTECKTHGRIFSRVEEPAEKEVQDVSEYGPSIPFIAVCNRCKKQKNGTFYGNNDYGMVCAECNGELAGKILGMNLIMAGD